MTKKYRLLKDIQQPNDHNYKAGEIFTKIKDDKDSAYLSADKKRAFHPDVIENRPEWFKKVIELPFVMNLDKYSTGDMLFYKFAISKKLHGDKIALITEAINNVLRQEPQKDYKILTCCGGGNRTIHPYEPSICLGASSTVAPCEINSIKRVSDNTIWTVEDCTLRGAIAKMEIDGEEILVTFKNTTNKYLKDI